MMNMKKYIFVLAALLLSACQLEGGAGTPSAPLSTAEVKQKLMMVSYSETPVPTATIDYQSTIAVVQEEAQRAQQEANQAQAEADAAKRLMVDATVTKEAVMLIAAQMTQSSEMLSAQGTQMAVQVTASAFPTSIPLTVTAQYRNDSVRETQQAANDPSFIEQRANAEAYAENAGMLMAVEIGLKWAIALFVVALGAALVIFVMRSEPKKDEAVEVRAFEPIPMAVDKDNSSRTLRAEIPCSVEQIVDLANGILHMKMTLAFGQWQGTSVHKSLKEIRDFFQEHKFAKLIPGKSGELIITAEGEEFLGACWDLREPPLPFRCIVPSPMNGNGEKVIPVI